MENHNIEIERVVFKHLGEKPESKTFANIVQKVTSYLIVDNEGDKASSEIALQRQFVERLELIRRAGQLLDLGSSFNSDKSDFSRRLARLKFSDDYRKGKSTCPLDTFSDIQRLVNQINEVVEFCDNSIDLSLPRNRNVNHDHELYLDALVHSYYVSFWELPRNYESSPSILCIREIIELVMGSYLPVTNKAFADRIYRLSRPLEGSKDNFVTLYQIEQKFRFHFGVKINIPII